MKQHTLVLISVHNHKSVEICEVNSINDARTKALRRGKKKKSFYSVVKKIGNLIVETYDI
jgi:hypothetical protein